MSGNYFLDIDWNQFTAEEKQKLQELAGKGDYNNLSAAIRVVRPEQEYELQKLVNILRPVDIKTDNKVRAEIEEKQRRTGKIVETPEEEAELQKRLDAEEVEIKAKAEEKKREVLAKKAEEIATKKKKGKKEEDKE